MSRVRALVIMGHQVIQIAEDIDTTEKARREARKADLQSTLIGYQCQLKTSGFGMSLMARLILSES